MASHANEIPGPSSGTIDTSVSPLATTSCTSASTMRATIMGQPNHEPSSPEFFSLSSACLSM